MNVLGTLPGSSSQQFALTSLDWLKILRMLLVQALGLFLTLGVPALLHYTYTWHGQDFTPEVVVLVNTLAELIRRFLAGSAQPAPVAVK